MSSSRRRPQLLCTGQTPNTALLRAFLPDCIVPNGAGKGTTRVARTMQVAIPRRTAHHRDVGVQDTVEQLQDQLARTSVADNAVLTGSTEPVDTEIPYPHLFAIGDAADAFGAIKAGHTAHYQVSHSIRHHKKSEFTEVCSV